MCGSERVCGERLRRVRAAVASRVVPGRHERRLADATVARRRVVIRLRVRQCSCGVKDCLVKTVVEREQVWPGSTCGEAPLLQKTLDRRLATTPGKSDRKQTNWLNIVVLNRRSTRPQEDRCPR